MRMADPGPDPHQSGSHHGASLGTLAVGAVGVVYGDIGTSPIYAFRETFAGHHPIAPDQLHIFGVLSLIFWSMTLIVTVKYVAIILRADNKGEGGSLALLALINRSTGGAKRWSYGIVLLGVFATALFFGDAMITPAISVLSAVEGLTTVNADLSRFVVPIAAGILIGLFAIQSHGTATVGRLFGPVMVAYFIVLAVLGIRQIVGFPSIIVGMLNPLNAAAFFAAEPWIAFVAMGTSVLAVTGAEALYADMGHFGRRPIAVAWIWFVMPALLLNYMGQGAMLLTQTPEQALETVKNPFFYLTPEVFRLPLVLLATAATIIASQAVISGAFSVMQQAVHLGFVPRLHVRHTSAAAASQIYIPAVNWSLLVLVLLLVFTFGSSSNLSAAYGIAVTGTMFIDTLLLAVVLIYLWRWNGIAVGAALAVFFTIDAAYFGANLLKVPSGGWFPLAIGLIAFVLLTTWARGRALLAKQLSQDELPEAVFLKSVSKSVKRVPGTAVFMTGQSEGVPHALLHNLKHNKILHERCVFLKVSSEDVPQVPDNQRVEVKDLGSGFYRILIRNGFMQDADVPAALAGVTVCGSGFIMAQTSFFLSRQTAIPSQVHGMALWRERLFAWMMRNAQSPMEFFCLPPNRVIELGSQVRI